MIPPSYYAILRPQDGALQSAPLRWSRSPLLALYKPHGILVHNSAFAGPKEETLLDLVQAQTQDTCFPLHRIDRGTSGLVLASDTREGIADWMNALHHPSTVREYIVILRGHLEHTVRVERPIPNAHGELLPSQTIFSPMRQSPTARLTLARARILTGRTHQIRRHARSLRHPVLGDSNWGDTQFNRQIREEQGIERMMLHAWRIQMTGPDGAEYDLVSIPDAGFQASIRKLFGFESWTTFASMSTLSTEAPFVYRVKGGSLEAVG